MPLIDPDKVQEMFLIIGDSWRGPSRKWYYYMAAVFILIIPVYIAVKVTSYNLTAGAYQPPNLLGQAQKEPLEILEKGFIRVSDTSYAAFVRVKNSNLDWGVPKFSYKSEITDISGELVSSVTNTTFILPASEKYILLPRFTSEKAPGQIAFTVTADRFVLQPPDFPDLQVEFQRSQVFPQGNDTIVTAVLKNNSPFTIGKVDIMAFIYNERSEVVAVNYTNINDLISGELRSFQLSWPTRIEGRLRVELLPEIDIFAKDILKTENPVSPFDR